MSGEQGPVAVLHVSIQSSDTPQAGAGRPSHPGIVVHPKYPPPHDPVVV
jgi:hypothetical protein